MMVEKQGGTGGQHSYLDDKVESESVVVAGPEAASPESGKAFFVQSVLTKFHVTQLSLT